MARRKITPTNPLRLFLREWRKHRRMTQAQLGARLKPPVDGVTISRYETGERRPDLDALATLAEALAIEPRDFYRHPDHESADALLRNQPDNIRAKALDLIRTLIS